MSNTIQEWLNENACSKCDYYCAKNNVCQSKKCATCGCHPYVNWFDRHFCKAYTKHIGQKVRIE